MRGCIRSRVARFVSSFAAIGDMECHCNPAPCSTRDTRRRLQSRHGYRATKRDLKRVLEASQRWTYIDMAIEPARAEELDTLELYQATSGGEAAVAKVRREAASRERIPG